MRPIRERNPIAVGVISVAVLAALVLAAFKFQDLPFIAGNDYSAIFTDASGLKPDNEVRIAGVKVGKVTDVALRSSPQGRPYVRIAFQVDRGVSFGSKTRATVRIKTVLGQKFLGLDPDGPDTMRDGDQIPSSRTASPFDVVQAVNGLADTVDKIDTKQLGQAFDTLSSALQDTPPAVKGSLTGLSRLSTTIASRDQALQQLLQRARGVTQVLADRDTQFQKLVTDGNLLLQEVNKRADAIHELLVSTNSLANQLSGLVTDNQNQLGPALTELRGVVATLQRNRGNLAASIKNLAPFLDAFTNVVGNGRWFDSYLDALLQPYQPGAPPARPANGTSPGSAATQTAPAPSSTPSAGSPAGSSAGSSAGASEPPSLIPSTSPSPGRR